MEKFHLRHEKRANGAGGLSSGDGSTLVARRFPARSGERRAPAVEVLAAHSGHLLLLPGAPPSRLPLLPAALRRRAVPPCRQEVAAAEAGRSRLHDHPASAPRNGGATAAAVLRGPAAARRGRIDRRLYCHRKRRWRRLIVFVGVNWTEHRRTSQ